MSFIRIENLTHTYDSKGQHIQTRGPMPHKEAKAHGRAMRKRASREVDEDFERTRTQWPQLRGF